MSLVWPSVLVTDRSACGVRLSVSVAPAGVPPGGVTVAVLARLPVAVALMVALTVYVTVPPDGMKVTVSLMSPLPVGSLPVTPVEPTLVQPTFLLDYPVELSPFAKRHRSKDDLVERFEVYAGGMEFGNAFTELNDPDDQRRRFEEQVRYAAAGDEETQPFDEAYLYALEHGMPPTTGIGPGLERMAMIFTEQENIDDVIFFPMTRPHVSANNAEVYGLKASAGTA